LVLKNQLNVIKKGICRKTLKAGIGGDPGEKGKGSVGGAGKERAGSWRNKKNFRTVRDILQSKKGQNGRANKKGGASGIQGYVKTISLDRPHKTASPSV